MANCATISWPVANCHEKDLFTVDDPNSVFVTLTNTQQNAITNHVTDIYEYPVTNSLIDAFANWKSLPDEFAV